MTINSLVWWHFSDLHWNIQASTERRAFLAVLHEDLRQRLRQFGPPQFVAFTGDIAYSGEQAQYLAAERDFFARSAPSSGMPVRFLCARQSRSAPQGAR